MLRELRAGQRGDAYLPPPWPGPLAGGDDLCLLRAGHGSVERGHKREQGEQELKFFMKNHNNENEVTAA